MSRTSLVVVAVVVLLALAAGYVAGVAHAVRVQCQRESQAAAQMPRESGVPIATPACDGCRDYFPDWVCWLAGCP